MTDSGTVPGLIFLLGMFWPAVQDGREYSFDWLPSLVTFILVAIGRILWQPLDTYQVLVAILLVALGGMKTLGARFNMANGDLWALSVLSLSVGWMTFLSISILSSCLGLCYYGYMYHRWRESWDGSIPYVTVLWVVLSWHMLGYLFSLLF